MNPINVNVIFRSLKSIFITRNHIHKEGGNFESLGSLHEIRFESFEITCQVMNESEKNILTAIKKYYESVIKEIEDRFTDKSIGIILIWDLSINVRSTRQRSLNAENVLVDLKSFTFSIKSMVSCGMYKADVGYCELEALWNPSCWSSNNCLSLLRDHLVYLNRILNKARNRLIPETLTHWS